MQTKKKVAVIGAGAWGTAISTVLAHNGHEVKIWCYEPIVAQEINQKHSNERYLRGITLDRSIIAMADLQIAVKDVHFIAFAVPIVYARSILQQLKSFISPDIPWIILNKGIENTSFMLPAQILAEVICPNSCVVLSGPSFACDLARAQITALDCAGTHPMIVKDVHELFENKYCRITSKNDFYGIQVVGALKNVIALASGMLEGADYSDNTKIFIIMQGMKEMEKVLAYYQGMQDTIYGLSGIGDMMLTALCGRSRNRACGFAIGQRQPLEQATKSAAGMVEGLNTLESLAQLSKKYSLDLPFFQGLHKIFFHGSAIDSWVEQQAQSG